MHGHTELVPRPACRAVSPRAAEEAVAEYEGEVDRLEQVLARAGPGVAEALAQGRAQSYCQVLLHSKLCCVIKFKYVMVTWFV